MPPSGRIAKPAKNATHVASSDAVGSAAGKNSLARTGAKMAYSEKSYHSITLPTVPAITTSRIARPLMVATMPHPPRADLEHQRGRAYVEVDSRFLRELDTSGFLPRVMGGTR